MCLLRTERTLSLPSTLCFFFFFNDTATPEIYTLSLHDALPIFAFEKFKGAEPLLSTAMKSVGEVMAIGRNFHESMQKALRGLETGLDGFNRVQELRSEERRVGKECRSRWSA